MRNDECIFIEYKQVHEELGGGGYNGMCGIYVEWWPARVNNISLYASKFGTIS